jgi:nucleoside-diphosphate-sugar epimerase
MKDRYLITGATGFIGSNVVHALVKRGKDVSILTHTKKPSWRLSDVAKKLRIYHCGLMDPKLQKVVDTIKPTVVFHFAAFGVNPWETDMDKMIDTNLRGVDRLITATKKHGFRLFINTGTSSEYGVKNSPMNEKDTLDPVNDYGITKSAATLLVTKRAVRENLPIITFRLFSPYGYFEHKNRLFPSVILQALAGKPITVSTPDHVRDFVFIEDVVDAYMKATEKVFRAGEVFNIAGGRERSVGEVVKTVMNVTKSKSPIAWGAVNDQGRQVEPPRWQGDISKSKKILGWKPYTKFVDGVKKTVAWLSVKKDIYE